MTNPMLLREEDLRLLLISTVCFLVVLAMFASPCSAAIRALCTGDASDVSLPLAVAQAVNCLLWGTYGLVTVDWLLIGPNGFGFFLAVLNILAKVRWLISGARKTTGPRTFEGEYLLQAVSTWARQGGFVKADEVQVSSMNLESEGSALRVVPMRSGTRDAVALRLEDGRFLCVEDRALAARGSRVNPSPFRVTALHREEPGSEGLFVPVYGEAACVEEIQDLEKREEHRTREEAISFWNPKYQVFVRANEAGALDCSVAFLVEPSQAPRVPAGWEWERFTLKPVPELRRRATFRSDEFTMAL